MPTDYVQHLGMSQNTVIKKTLNDFTNEMIKLMMNDKIWCLTVGSLFNALLCLGKCLQIFCPKIKGTHVRLQQILSNLNQQILVLLCLSIHWSVIKSFSNANCITFCD